MRAAMFLRLIATRLADAVDVEGALLLIGTACLAVFASYVSPAGPWLVVGAMAAVLGFIRMTVNLLVALRRRRAE